MPRPRRPDRTLKREAIGRENGAHAPARDKSSLPDAPAPRRPTSAPEPGACATCLPTCAHNARVVRASRERQPIESLGEAQHALDILLCVLRHARSCHATRVHRPRRVIRGTSCFDDNGWHEDTSSTPAPARAGDDAVRTAGRLRRARRGRSSTVRVVGLRTETSTRLRESLQRSVVVRGDLEAGFGRSRLTPTLNAERDDPARGQFRSMPLAGFGERDGKPATGTHDDIEVKAVALRVAGISE